MSSAPGPRCRSPASMLFLPGLRPAEAAGPFLAAACSFCPGFWWVPAGLPLSSALPVLPPAKTRACAAAAGRSVWDLPPPPFASLPLLGAEPLAPAASAWAYTGALPDGACASATEQRGFYPHPVDDVVHQGGVWASGAGPAGASSAVVPRGESTGFLLALLRWPQTRFPSHCEHGEVFLVVFLPGAASR